MKRWGSKAHPLARARSNLEAAHSEARSLERRGELKRGDEPPANGCFGEAGVALARQRVAHCSVLVGRGAAVADVVHLAGARDGMAGRGGGGRGVEGKSQIVSRRANEAPPKFVCCAA